MTEEGDEGVPEGVVGLPLSDAVDTVVAGEDDHDPKTVRTALERVTEDGVVSQEAVESALAHLSKVVSTPETRVELAALALSDAREAAEPVADLGVVRSRLDGFEMRLAAVEEQVAALGPALQTLVGRADDSGEVYEVAVEIRRITAEANAAQQAADSLGLDLEEFERWVTSQSRRVRDLEADLDALADAQNDLTAVADRLAGAEADPATGDSDPAVAWYDAAVRQRVQGLLLADLRGEFADLRAWADREGLDDDWTDELAARLDCLHDQWTATGERLDDLARPTWTDRFGERVAAFETTLDGFEPPVDWGEVQAALDEHRLDGEE